MAFAPKPFSLWRFATLVALQLALLLLGLRVLLPQVWASQVAAGAAATIAVFLGAHLLNCFVEWAFHRYVLHTAPLVWLRSFERKHRRHHELTPIRFRREATGRRRTILNQFPIEHEEQYENSQFPFWALVGFWVLFTPLLVALQLALPRLPILVGGYAAVTWSLACYEIFHHVEHLPFAWWQQRIAHPRWGRYWKKVYGFHHMHHANADCNMAISGFFGLPLADWLLKTYHQPRQLLLDGQEASSQDFALPPARRLVRWLDRRVKQRASAQRAAA